MRKVAFLASRNVLPGESAQRADSYEFQLEFDALGAPCAARDITLEAVAWDAPALEPRAYDAVVIGTTWDYWERQAEFLSRLEAIETAGAALLNPLSIVRWNIDKGYLADLEAAGAPSVPTVFAKRADADTLTAAFDTLEADTIVVKPRIGAGAWRQARLTRGAPIARAQDLPPGDCLIQPFLTHIPTWGEVSFLFFGGVFSHALRKVPKAGDYRVQSLYGAHEEPHHPSPEELACASDVLATIEARAGAPLLYARIDMTRGNTGGLVLMEAELIEPYYYPEQGPGCGQVFADALAARLDALAEV